MSPELIAAQRGVATVLLYRDLPSESPRITEYRKISNHDCQGWLLAFDIIVAFLSGLVVFGIYALPRDYGHDQLWIGLGGFGMAWAVSAYMQELYGRKALLAGLYRLLLRTAATCALTFGIILLLGFGLNLIAGVSRVWLLTWAASVFVWTGLARILCRDYVRRQLRRGGCFERALVFAGSAHAAWRLGETIEHESRNGLRVAAATALPGTLGAPTLRWVEDAVGGGLVDRVIVGNVAGAMPQVNALLARLTRLAVDVTVLPDLTGLQAPVLSVDRIGMLPAIDLDFRPLTLVQLRLKRGEDLILAGLAAIFVLPVLVAISVAIKVDSPGPVLFRQKRQGFNSRTFEVWKFRTMHAHTRDDHAIRQTSRHDNRVTRVGRFLRRTSLDELPQLFNVLAGQMSVVGPRPHALGMTAVGLPLHEVIEEYAARHRLKPGITGWAQINGSRGEVDSHEKLRRRVALDCFYIDNWSLGLDLWIVIRTATMLLSDPNAY